MKRFSMGTLVVGLLALTGCSSFKLETTKPRSLSSRDFEAGQATVAAVVHELGPPHQASALADGFVFLYDYSGISEFQLGLSVDRPPLTYFKFIKAWNHLNQDVRVMIFDEDGVLRSVNRAQWRESMGGGSAIQFLFTVVSLSDSSKFLHRADAHDWGQRLLQPLPVALNSANSLHNGENGLQQRMTIEYAGQQTLEMARPKTSREMKKAKKDYQSK
jgi:hypothetical protein